MTTIYLTIIACMAVALAVGCAHGYVRRKQAPLPVTSTPLPATSVDPAMAALIDELDEETERWLWKALAKGTGYRVWRSDPMFEGDQVSHAFAILAPGEQAPGEGTVLSWT